MKISRLTNLISLNSWVGYARCLKRNLHGIKSYEIPEHLIENYRPLSQEGESRIVNALKNHYFSYSEYFPDPVEVYLSSEDGLQDLQSHVHGRLDSDRQMLVPWLNATVSLKGAKVLEIGCGTGSSTVAMAEQGAEVLAYDVHEASLWVAACRLKAYGLNAELKCANATDVFRHLEKSEVDIIAFIAVLEHMTLDERLTALRYAWDCLPSGGYLVVQETPNRLWYHDKHTSREDFFHWLPDDLAIRYSSLTRRDRYNRLFANQNTAGPAKQLEFARWGRGVSFHDFVLAFGVSSLDLPVVSSMVPYFRQQGAWGVEAESISFRYEELLAAISPSIHKGFFLEYLDLIFKKP